MKLRSTVSYGSSVNRIFPGNQISIYAKIPSETRINKMYWMFRNILKRSRTIKAMFPTVSYSRIKSCC